MSIDNGPPLVPNALPAASRQASKPDAGITPTATSEPTHLWPISAKIGRELSQEIDAYAETLGITRSRAAAQYLDIASEAIRERKGIPGGRADELLEVLEGLRILIDMLGPPTFGILRLLAHWASQTDAKFRRTRFSLSFEASALMNGSRPSQMPNGLLKSSHGRNVRRLMDEISRALTGNVATLLRRA